MNVMANNHESKTSIFPWKQVMSTLSSLSLSLIFYFIQLSFSIMVEDVWLSLYAGQIRSKVLFYSFMHLVNSNHKLVTSKAPTYGFFRLNGAFHFTKSFYFISNNIFIILKISKYYDILIILTEFSYQHFSNHSLVAYY